MAFMLLPPFFLSFLSVFSVDPAQGLVGLYHLDFSKQICLPYMELNWSGLPSASSSSTLHLQRGLRLVWPPVHLKLVCSNHRGRVQKARHQTLQEALLLFVGLDSSLVTFYSCL